MSSADTGFEHATAPCWNAFLETVLLNLPCLPVAGYTPQLDVDDTAGSHGDCSLHIAQAMDALVQADRRTQLPLQLGMLINLIPAQRLLHIVEGELVEPSQRGYILKRIGGVCVNGQRNIRVCFAHGLDDINIVPWLDLELDAPVSGRQLSSNAFQQYAGVFVNAHRYAARQAFEGSTQQGPERDIARACCRIPCGSLKRSLGHFVAAYRSHRSGERFHTVETFSNDSGR